MKGIVVWWPGLKVDIPAGWHACDGTDGTPDYTDCVLVGAGGDYAEQTNVGSKDQVHTFTGGGHNHPIPAGTGIAAGADYSLTTDTAPADGETNPADNLPRARAGWWIIKL